ncbi:MAG TPA: helix-turn-helix transcriptional regulator [Candidatus Olsenella avistercoris]|nr:helix-turn-helix transcriptional regulator [Candidatus Olsenella avistercoris]
MAVTRESCPSGTELERQYPSERLLEYVMDFCFMVEDRLEELGMTRSELAKRLGRKPSSVSRVLSGTANVTLKTIAEYDAALGLNIRIARGSSSAGCVPFRPTSADSEASRDAWRSGVERTDWSGDHSGRTAGPEPSGRDFWMVGGVAA